MNAQFSIAPPDIVCLNQAWAGRSNVVAAVVTLHQRPDELWQQAFRHSHFLPKRMFFELDRFVESLGMNRNGAYAPFMPNLSLDVASVTASAPITPAAPALLSTMTPEVIFVPLFYELGSNGDDPLLKKKYFNQYRVSLDAPFAGVSSDGRNCNVAFRDPTTIASSLNHDHFFLYEDEVSDFLGGIDRTCPVVDTGNGIGIAAFLAIPLAPQRNIRWLSEKDTEKRAACAYLTFRGIILADLEFTFGIEGLADTSVFTSFSGEVARSIFASYAREDLEVVHSIASILKALDLGELRWDLEILRAGDDWNEVLRGEIERATIFQLFWSTHPARSKMVKQEWTHALSLGRNHFVRPVFWRQPMPPPPHALKALHFSKIQLLDRS